MFLGPLRTPWGLTRATELINLVNYSGLEVQWIQWHWYLLISHVNFSQRLRPKWTFLKMFFSTVQVELQVENRGSLHVEKLICVIIYWKLYEKGLMPKFYSPAQSPSAEGHRKSTCSETVACLTQITTHLLDSEYFVPQGASEISNKLRVLTVFVDFEESLRTWRLLRGKKVQAAPLSLFPEYLKR